MLVGAHRLMSRLLQPGRGLCPTPSPGAPLGRWGRVWGHSDTGGLGSEMAV